MVELDGDRAVAVDWGCGEVWVLRDVRAELKAGSAWAERLRRCRATVSFEVAGVRGGRRRCFRGSGQGGVAREGGVQCEGEWVQEITGVPRGAVGKAGGSLRPPTTAGSAGGGEAERERGGRRLLGLFANSKKFRDPTVKLR